MKLGSSLILFACLFVVFPLGTLAQNANSAASALEDLRSHLSDVQAKEAALQTRAKQLDEDLKPENIERSLAGIGSTRPEELRELRRSQLSREKASVLAQLEILAKSHARLEAAILAAEAAAYQQSAQGTVAPVEQMMITQGGFANRWVVLALVGVIAFLGVAVLLVLLRKLRRV